MVALLTNARAFVAGRFGLVIDGRPQAGYVKSIEGGLEKSASFSTGSGLDPLGLKQLGVREIEPISVEMGLASGRDVFQWISDSWRGEPSRRSGEVIHANANLQEVLTQEFSDALLSEVTFPALDGGSNALNTLKFKFLAEAVALKRSEGTLSPFITGKQKQNAASMFQLSIDGVASGVRVSKIDSFTVKQSLKPFYFGASPLPELEPTRFEFPDLAITLPVSGSESVRAWWEASMKGVDTKQQRSGVIEFLSVDKTITDPKKRVLFSVGLDRIAIKSYAITRSEAEAASQKTARVELAVGAMSLHLGAGID